ncbi:MAG: hypothetical protein AAF577_08530 [Pseudomonadota bacterium]
MNLFGLGPSTGPSAGPSAGPARMLLVGALPRLAGAAGVIALLWLGFSWATASIGAG